METCCREDPTIDSYQEVALRRRPPRCAARYSSPIGRTRLKIKEVHEAGRTSAPRAKIGWEAHAYAL